MPATLNDIRAATDRVQAAQTQLEEVAAMVELERLVRHLTRHVLHAAFEVFTPTEIARALGQSRQAVSQKRKRAGAAAGPSTESPLDGRNLS